MKIKLAVLGAMLGAAAACTSMTAWSQNLIVDGLGFRLGDKLAAVKAALHTTADPVPMEGIARPPFVGLPTGKTSLQLQDKGIRVFFDQHGQVDTIRLDPPFAGSVSGIKLGDTERTVRAFKGDPIEAPWAYDNAMVFLYVLDDAAHVRYDINDAGVRSMYIRK